MKNTLHFMMAGMIGMVPLAAKCQTPLANSANAQLRQIFSPVSFADPNVLFLYDRSVKLSDTAFYSPLSVDTLSTTDWFQLHSEMYYAAHDTSLHIATDQIWQSSNSFSGDTIPLVMMDYDFYQLIPGALQSNTYFNFDPAQNLLFDNPQRTSEPYERRTIFAAAPAVPQSSFSSVTFRIDPALILKDITNQYYHSTGANWHIDFGDGSGWHTMNPNAIQHFNINYPAAGNYTITVSASTHQVVIKNSMSRITIASGQPAVAADTVLSFPGMTVGVYNNCASEEVEKVIIYLEGFDMLDMHASTNRDHQEIYNEMIGTRHISELRNFGYKYYVVDWNNSRIDMRFNALYLLNLVEYIKATARNRQQIVMIGESMGGVIGRFLLTYMETDSYMTGDFSPFFAEASDPSNSAYLLTHGTIFSVAQNYRQSNLVSHQHRTRLLITLDAPHQGANIPLSLQHLYSSVLNLLPFGQLNQTLQQAFNLALQSKAARQLLTYHINTGNGQQQSAYGPDNSHLTFFQQLEDMGDYPEHCKLTALSSGALAGQNQENYFNASFRQPADDIVNLDLIVNLNILGVTFPFFKADYELLTNPNGSGNFTSLKAGYFTYQFQLYFFGISVLPSYNLLIDTSLTALNVQPFCTSAGGFEGVQSPSFPNPASYQLSQSSLLNVFGYSFGNENDGCFNVSGYLGWNGVSASQVSMTLCTDGFHFGFVSVQSALDYGAGLNLPLNHNIEQDPINLKNVRTPFDVIIGYPNVAGNAKNHHHLAYRDPLIYNLTRLPAIQSNAPFEEFTFHSMAMVNQHDVRRSLLCLEIGDEELYLENMNLNRPADFQAEYDLRINHRNPYYQYPSQNITLSGMRGAYSRQAPFTTTNGANLIRFFFDQNGSPSTQPGFSMAQPLIVSPFSLFNQPLILCGVSFNNSMVRQIPVVEKIEEEEAKFDLQIYPNPGSANQPLHYSIRGAERMNGFAEITCYDMTGRVVGKQGLNLSGGASIEGDLRIPDVSEGMYIITLRSPDKIISKKLIINRHP